MGLLASTHRLDRLCVCRRADDLHPRRLLAAAFDVLGTDIHDAVRVNLEGHGDLRGASRRRLDATELDLSEARVFGEARARPLRHSHAYGALAVVAGGECARALARDGRVRLDEQR